VGGLPVKRERTVTWAGKTRPSLAAAGNALLNGKLEYFLQNVLS
jgi:hypothetical protein